jgi:ribosomal protein S18 acetylase RimI-like enzyme
MESSRQGLERAGTESELLSSAVPADLVQIREIEQSTFNWETTEADLDELESKIKDDKNIVAVLRNQEHEIVGYVVGVPSMTLDAKILAEDPGLTVSEDKMYIETLAIAKKYQGSLVQIKDLLQTLLDRARAEGYLLIAGHVPEKHYSLYKRFYNARNIRTLENWFGSGEDHYYIEFPS